MAFDFISASLAARKTENLFRSRTCFEQVSATKLVADGVDYLNFASNDYLGLAQSIDVEKFSAKSGSGSSALVTGHTQLHEQFEQRLAKLLGYESALLFGSGFAANSSVLKCLFSQLTKADDAAVFHDKLNHASLIDGSLSGTAKLHRFNHNDTNHLRARLEKARVVNKLIVTEGVFSMDGDTAALEEISRLAKAHNAWLMVDDAHAFGVIGERGLGSIEKGIKPDILIITFGKAMGCQGAAVLASKTVIEYLIQFNREYIYSTNLSPIFVEVAQQQLDKLIAANEARTMLLNNILYFKQQANKASLALIESDTAIQPLILGSAENAMLAQQFLKQHGIWVSAIRPPTVPVNTARLRITLTAAHTHNDIDKLVATLKELPC
ncbi:aminotransferase class I/II-fold pyridoxal phosphate-dependent enzyme [Pseudoalteromonas sp. T1lg65]|uniref:aminotransferase class I/II-fold pyridoxal phosphate-dependent enzyme n=1 Tax=Pseudoalteromonas sp. T1lg65 TaxID=2077101 RepID=UPI003F78D32A